MPAARFSSARTILRAFRAQRQEVIAAAPKQRGAFTTSGFPDSLACEDVVVIAGLQTFGKNVLARTEPHARPATLGSGSGERKTLFAPYRQVVAPDSGVITVDGVEVRDPCLLADRLGYMRKGLFLPARR